MPVLGPPRHGRCRELESAPGFPQNPSTRGGCGRNKTDVTEPIHRNSLKPGHRLHWYRIEKVLGQGGFGITYLAHDFNLDHEVAIKEYLPMELAVRERDSSVQPASDTHGERFKWGLDRFMAEAQTLARFKHPNIVRVLAVFEANRTGYMVMEYEHGDTLHEILTRRQTLEEEELLNIVLPILGGLEKVHERGFIHRDIKPANIFIRKDGSPVLIDFGSARQALGAETRALTTLVSPGYAPFEQYFSKGEQQGPWTDIYGLGATLYRAVTGQPPQDAVDRSRAILEAARDTLGDIGEIGRGRYSARFLKAIDHALKFRPKDRPQSVAEWRREFAVLPDARPKVKPPDSAVMGATIAADEPRSAPIPPAAPSPAQRAVPDGRAAGADRDEGRRADGLTTAERMAPKILARGAGREPNPPAVPPLVRRTGSHVQAAKVVAEEPRSEPVPPSSARFAIRRKGLAPALVAAAVVATAAFWVYQQAAQERETAEAQTALRAADAALAEDDAPSVLARLEEARKAGVDPAVLDERRWRLRDRIETLAIAAASDAKQALQKNDAAAARAAIKRARDLKAQAEPLKQAAPERVAADAALEQDDVPLVLDRLVNGLENARNGGLDAAVLAERRRKAAEQGNALAQQNLGFRYWYGGGVPRTTRKR